MLNVRMATGRGQGTLTSAASSCGKCLAALGDLGQRPWEACAQTCRKGRKGLSPALTPPLLQPYQGHWARPAAPGPPAAFSR